MVVAAYLPKEVINKTQKLVLMKIVLMKTVVILPQRLSPATQLRSSP